MSEPRELLVGLLDYIMVVEGSGDLRLAIECDGDEFHGADRWQHDMNRQRVLERAGWTFWRCFASTWVLRKDEVMHELVEYLYRIGIEPLGAIEHASRLVEKRIWKDSSSTEPSDEGNSYQSDAQHGDALGESRDERSMVHLRSPEARLKVPENGHSQQRATGELSIFRTTPLHSEFAQCLGRLCEAVHFRGERICFESR